MDSTVVVSTAITGLVGIAGVAGTIISARIAGNSARESAQLSIAAQAELARRADKRQVYARFMAAFDAVVATMVEAKSSEGRGSDSANFRAVRRDLGTLSNELILVAPRPVTRLTGQARKRLDDYWGGRCDVDALLDARNEAYYALSADLEDEAED